MLSNYKEEIVSLRNQVNSLSNELALLKGNQVPTDVSDSSYLMTPRCLYLVLTSTLKQCLMTTSMKKKKKPKGV